MLSSLQGLNTSMSGGHTSPHLEPISGPEGPQEHENRWRGEARVERQQDAGTMNHDDDDTEGDNDLPLLRSLSSSSSSSSSSSIEDEHTDQVEAASDPSQTLFEHVIGRGGVDHESMRQRPLFRWLGGGIQTSQASISSETGTLPTVPSSTRFRTVVDREETRMIIDVDDDNDDESDENVEEDKVKSKDEVIVEPLRTPTPTLSEPPFVTDGRGRVVWSSSAANKTMDHDGAVECNAQTTLLSFHSAQTVAPCPPSSSSAHPTTADQVSEVSRVLSNDGFTTDGRGRVINIGNIDDEGFHLNFACVTPQASASPRSFLGRMFDALF
jgi:hypothetical protein